MLTYGGVALGIPTPEIAGFVEQYLSLGNVFDHEKPAWQREPWLTQAQANRYASIWPNVLYWPVGASRWAFGYFVVDTESLAKIRRLAYVANAVGSHRALTLKMSEGSGLIETDLFMLPPRPLAQFTQANGLWLLPLVDARYFWWEIAANIAVVENTTTWANLFTSIGTALGLTVATDAISSSYLKPSAAFAGEYTDLPILLDRIAAAVGHRVVRRLNGSVVTQSAATAKAAQDKQLATWPRVAGGQFALTPRADAHDLAGLVPASVTFAFPRLDVNAVPDGTWYTITKTLAGLTLADYGTVVGHNGTHVVRSGLPATYSGVVTPANDTELQAFATRFATDWYTWRLPRLAVNLAGAVPYEPDAFSDHIEWSLLGTRVQRHRWADSDEAAAVAAYYGSAGSIGTIIYNAVTFLGGDVSFISNDVTVSGDTWNFESNTDIIFDGDVNIGGTTWTFTATTINFVSQTEVNFGTTATQSSKPPGVLYLPHCTGSGIPSWAIPASSVPIQAVPGNGTLAQPPVLYIGVPGTSTFYPILTQPPVHNNATTIPFEIFNLPILTVAGPPTWTPAANTYPLIISTNDKKWYWWDSSAWQVVDTFTDPMTTTGDIIYQAGGGVPARLPIGTSGYVLTVSGGLPVWAAGMTNPMTTAGDTIYGGASGSPTRLAANGRKRNALLTQQSLVSTIPVWAYAHFPLFVQTSNVTVANTTTETTLVTGATPTVYAGEMDVSSTFRVTMGGYYKTDMSGATLQLQAYMGSVSVIDSGGMPIPVSVTDKGWMATILLTIRNSGATGTIIGQGEASFGGAINDVAAFMICSTATTTVDFLTIDNAIDLTATWSVASANVSVTCTNLLIEQIR